MKLSYFQLENQLNKALAPLYIVSGDELLLKQDAIDLIRKSAKKAGFLERTHFVIDAELDVDQLYTHFYSPSLFGDKNLIEMDFRDGTPSKVINNLLQDYLKKPSPNQILLLIFGKLDQRSEKTIWFQSLEKIGLFVPIWPVPREQFPEWIMQRAKVYSLNLPPKIAALIAEYTEGNLTAAKQTLEKLQLMGPSTIDDKVIHDMFNDSLIQFTIFDLMENLINKHASRTFHILNALEKEDTEPALVLWGITRELRILSELAMQKQKGGTLSSLFQKHRIPPRRQSAMQSFLLQCQIETLWQALKQAAEIDRVIKGASSGNAWDQFQLLCLRILDP